MFALRMRVNMSATGSVTLAIDAWILVSCYLPRRLGDAGNETAVRELAKTNAAQAELAQIAAWPAAHLAVVTQPRFEFLFTLGPFDNCGCRHISSRRAYAAAPSLRSGMPISPRNASACSSVCALVTITMSMPRTFLTLS